MTCIYTRLCEGIQHSPKLPYLNLYTTCALLCVAPSHLCTSLWQSRDAATELRRHLRASEGSGLLVGLRAQTARDALVLPLPSYCYSYFPPYQLQPNYYSCCCCCCNEDEDDGDGDDNGNHDDGDEDNYDGNWDPINYVESLLCLRQIVISGFYESHCRCIIHSRLWMLSFSVMCHVAV